jgi:Fe-S-cluster containining protein
MEKTERRFGCETCDHCALCCKGWDIELTKEDIRSLAGLGYRLGDFLEIRSTGRSLGPPIMRTAGKERNCIFLDGENMCVLEKRHGHDAKPHTCKLYPKIRPEALAEKDYFFYEYGGKTFPRDFFAKMLDRVKDTSEKELFSVLLYRLEKLRKQKAKYIDHFNYNDNRRHSELKKAFSRRRVRKLSRAKFRKDDVEGFGGIKGRKNFNVRVFVETLQKGIPRSDAINPNLPEMLLAYLLFVQKSEPKDAKAMAEHFFAWNGKRF